tara:strand:+ start:2636 stop:2986 length:351 start_codon:yes stop_codon:yes gene_type:complete
MKKATPSFPESSPSQANDSTTPAKRKTKLARILEHFVNGGSLNRFEAERLGDHCLNSTIAALCGSHGLAFIRIDERVPNRFGSETRVTRYSLPETELARASKVLSRVSKTPHWTAD